MNLKVLFSLLAAGIVFLNCANVEKTKTVSKVEPPSLYTDLEGRAMALEDYKGKRILLNFWATWCIPCLKEMPSMARAQAILKDENYVFLFATTDPIKKVNTFIENNAYPFEFIQYTGTLDKLNIHALPATLIYDTRGNLAKRIDGMTEWDSEAVLDQLKAVE